MWNERSMHHWGKWQHMRFIYSLSIYSFNSLIECEIDLTVQKFMILLTFFILHLTLFSLSCCIVMLCSFFFCIPAKYIHSFHSSIRFFGRYFSRRLCLWWSSCSSVIDRWHQWHLPLASRSSGQCQPKFPRYILLPKSIQRWY